MKYITNAGSTLKNKIKLKADGDSNILNNIR